MVGIIVYRFLRAEGIAASTGVMEIRNEVDVTMRGVQGS